MQWTSGGMRPATSPAEWPRFQETTAYEGSAQLSVIPNVTFSITLSIAELS
jgi:hypothetical protein